MLVVFVYIKGNMIKIFLFYVLCMVKFLSNLYWKERKKKVKLLV